MKKIVRLISLVLLPIIVAFSKPVFAAEINVEQVVQYMETNNIFEDEEYFRLFGRVLNGNNEYDIEKITYTIETTSNRLIIKTKLIDKTIGEINKTTTLNYYGNEITYNNPNALDSLESRIDTLLLTELVYSIGGARGYNKLALINWMNQIDLNNTITSDGIESDVEKVTYNYEHDGKKYNYVLEVPVTYLIKINELTTNLIENDYVSISEVNKTTSSITVKLFSEEHTDEECELYRLNDDNKYIKIATVSCNNGQFTDKNLKENQNYTYQATVKNKIVCSDNRSITTEPVPPTGAFTYLWILIIIMIISIWLYFSYKKYNLLRKV